MTSEAADAHRRPHAGADQVGPQTLHLGRREGRGQLVEQVLALVTVGTIHEGVGVLDVVRPKEIDDVGHTTGSQARHDCVQTRSGVVPEAETQVDESEADATRLDRRRRVEQALRCPFDHLRPVAVGAEHVARGVDGLRCRIDPHEAGLRTCHGRPRKGGAVAASDIEDETGRGLERCQRELEREAAAAGRLAVVVTCADRAQSGLREPSPGPVHGSRRASPVASDGTIDHATGTTMANEAMLQPPDEDLSSRLPVAITAIAAEAGTLLQARHHTVAVAEGSCGGLVSAALLAVPGASAYYVGGTVIYTVAASRAFLAGARPVPPGLRGASEPFARYLAESIRSKLGTTWGIGEGGAAGPSGNRYGDPAGHAWFAVDGPAPAAHHLLTGDDDRERNMVAFAAAALELLVRQLRAA